MLARVFEEAGLSTTSIVLIREHAERVKPPRALFVPFPFGFAFGNPDDPPFQHRVLAAALDGGEALAGAIRLASVAGGLACEIAGAQPSLPKRKAIDEALPRLDPAESL